MTILINERPNVTKYSLVVNNGITQNLSLSTYLFVKFLCYAAHTNRKVLEIKYQN